MRVFVVSLFAGTLLLIAGGAFAGEETVAATSRTLTLDEALRRALEFNPEIARVGANYADKLATAIETEVKINPGFKLTAARSSESGDAGGFFEAEAEQPLRPSDFGLRRTFAVALRAAADLEQQADVLRVLNETAVLYYRTWALQERITLLSGARDQAGQVVRTINEQLKAGQSDVSQQNIFRAEEARFAAELVAVRGERAGALSELQRATGYPFRELRLTRPVLAPLPDTFALAAFAETRASLRRIALARQTAATRSLMVARADGVWPEFAPGLIYSYDGLRKESEFGFTLAGRLPLWDRNQGPITRARGAVQAAEREVTSFDRVTMDRLIELRRQQVLNLEARAKSFRSDVIPAYRAAYDASLNQFRAGQATTLQLFEVQKSLIDTQEKAYQYQIEALSARNQLEQLIGGRIEEVSVTRRSRQSTDYSK